MFGSVVVAKEVSLAMVTCFRELMVSGQIFCCKCDVSSN